MSAVIDRWNDQSGINYAAKHQCDVVVGENSIEIGTVDLRLSYEILGETSTEEGHSIDFILCEPALGLFAPSDMTSATPTYFLTSLPNVTSFSQNCDGPGDKADGKNP